MIQDMPRRQEVAVHVRGGKVLESAFLPCSLSQGVISPHFLIRPTLPLSPSGQTMSRRKFEVMSWDRSCSERKARRFSGWRKKKKAQVRQFKFAPAAPLPAAASELSPFPGRGRGRRASQVVSDCLRGSKSAVATGAKTGSRGGHRGKSLW